MQPVRKVERRDAFAFLLGDVGTNFCSYAALTNSLAKYIKTFENSSLPHAALLQQWRIREVRPAFIKAIARAHAANFTGHCMPDKDVCVFTSLPDLCEMRFDPGTEDVDIEVRQNLESLKEFFGTGDVQDDSLDSSYDYQLWRCFFVNAVKSVMLALPNNALSIFYQTDLKGTFDTQVSKSHLVQSAMEELKEDSLELSNEVERHGAFLCQSLQGLHLAWHKVATFDTFEELQRKRCEATAVLESKGLYREIFQSTGPAYSHLLCVRKGRPAMSDEVWLKGWWKRAPDCSHVVLPENLSLATQNINADVAGLVITLKPGRHGEASFEADGIDREKETVVIGGILYRRAEKCRSDRHWSDVSLPDILERGSKVSQLKNRARAMGVATTHRVLAWVRRNFLVKTVVDPFCGTGTVLAVANSLGFAAIGGDISARRVRQASNLEV